MIYIITVLLHSFMFSPSYSSQLSIELEGYHEGKGQFIIALFDSSEKFDEQKDPAYYLTVDNQREKDKHRVIEFSKIVPGRYAIAVFQDINMNGELDKNWMGIPKEPYGFSGGGSFKWRPPTFEEAAFTADEGPKLLKIKLEEW